jgi:16S rRNA (adenine1518-N6/adenine1519-N6)-dimethyltransferase
MTVLATPKSLLKKYKIRPVKRLGQSFLIDPNVLAKIIKSAHIETEDVVVEIGAGIGVMTALIAKEAKNVIALEIDRAMIDILREELKEYSNIEIIETDVLRYDVASIRKGVQVPKLKIIGNIPYNISAPILFHLLDYRHLINSITIMLQKEVAERIAAIPGTKAYGTLSVILSMYFKVSKEFNVPAKCFYPPPKVDSTVLKMTVRDEPLVRLRNPDIFRHLVRTAFGKRRKTLINNIKNSNIFYLASHEDLLQILKSQGIDGGRRGETLTAEEFGRLSNAISLRNYTNNYLDKENFL